MTRFLFAESLSWLTLLVLSAGDRLGRQLDLAPISVVRSRFPATSKTDTDCFWSRSIDSTHRETKLFAAALSRNGFGPINFLLVNCSASTHVPSPSTSVPFLPFVTSAIQH